MYMLLPFLFVYYAGRYFLPAEKVQRYLSITHTYTTILIYLPYCYFSNLRATIYQGLYFFSMSYFTNDTIIIALHNRKDWLFILHHLATLWLFLQLKFIPDIDLQMKTYFYIELSNAFLTLYEMKRTHLMKSYLAAFYVPYRLLVIPYYCYRNMMISTSLSTTLVPLSALIVMSMVYAVKLLKYPMDYVSLIPLYIDIELLYHVLPYVCSYKYILVPYVLYDLFRNQIPYIH